MVKCRMREEGFSCDLTYLHMTSHQSLTLFQYASSDIPIMLRQSHPHVTRSLLYTSARMFTATVPFSTRHRPLELDKSQSVEPQTPRYLRRQSLQKGKAGEEGGIALFRQNDIPRYRSKHLTPDPSTRRETNKEGLKLLEPHVLSQRIKKLCDRGKLDDAVSLLQNSPLVAQNTPVWNTLIWETMKVQRYKLAYTLYIDVCRLNFYPKPFLKTRTR